MDIKKQTRFNPLIKNPDTRFSPRIRQYQVIAIVLLLALVNFFSGCMSVGKSLRSKDNFMEHVYLKEIKQELPNSRENQDLQVSFENALLLSVLRDENLSLIRFSWQKEKLDLKQARSMIFPRVKLHVYNETYYSNIEKKIKDNIDAGLMFQYDFLNLFFQSGHLSIKKAALQSSIIKGRIEIQSLYFRFLLLLMEIDHKRKEIALTQEFLEYAKSGLALSKRLARDGRIKTGEIWTWSNHIYDAQERFEEGRDQLEFLQRSLKYMLGKADVGKIEILNAKDFFPDSHIPTYHKNQIKTVIQDAWENRPEVKLAEINLFLSEMKLLKSKLNWLSYFRISLGFGRFFIYRDDDRASVTLNTSVSLPIFDMGDTRRIKKKAEIDREISRNRVNNVARMITREAHEAVKKVHTLQSRDQNSEKLVQSVEQQKETVKRLISQNQTEALDLYLARMACLNARLKSLRSKFQLNKAILSLKKVSGTLLAPELEELLIQKMLGEK